MTGTSNFTNLGLSWTVTLNPLSRISSLDFFDKKEKNLTIQKKGKNEEKLSNVSNYENGLYLESTLILDSPLSRISSFVYYISKQRYQSFISRVMIKGNFIK